MNVVIHGEAREYCDSLGLVVVGEYDGSLEEYKGLCPIVVTGEDMEENEYYYLKYLLLRRKVELISVRWNNEHLNSFVVYLNEREHDRGRHTGRLPYGFMRRNGVVVENPEKILVALEILRLRDEGKTYRDIKKRLPREMDMSISTIATICEHRERYEH